jgi:hypothetical protein
MFGLARLSAAAQTASRPIRRQIVSQLETFDVPVVDHSRPYPTEWWQKEDLLLNVGSQMEQFHDLCHAGPGNAAESGQFGIIPNRSRRSLCS